VVNDVDPDQFTDLLQAAGHGAIFGAGGRIAGWMIVYKQDCRSGIANGRAKNFAWMDEACVECSDSDLVAGYGLELRIK
jgi:hypothetical protein